MLQLFSNKKSNKHVITTINSDPFIGDSFSVVLNGSKILENINLKINDGDFLFLTGESGAGKTTFLKVLASEVLPSRGRVAGKCFRKEYYIAKIFQDLRLIEEFTCRENLEIAFDSKIYKSRREFESDVSQLCRIFEIENKLDRPVKLCNRGTKQLLAIIRALLTRPNMLLADEPTSSLDSSLANKLFDVLNFYNSKRGLTIVWTSHNRELVNRFNGKKVSISRGRIQSVGNGCLI